MNFEDEPYARLYIRRTLTNKRLRWEGRAVLHEMLYVFDRAGVFEFTGELSDAIELMCELPAKVVKVGLQRLLESETWVVCGRFLVWPNYLEAQTCSRSDAARQKDSRDRRRAMAHAAKVLGEHAPAGIGHEAIQPVTSCDASTGDVTIGHVQSHSVTLSLAVPSLAGPSTHTDAGVRETPAGDSGDPAARELQVKAAAYLHDPTRAAMAYGAPDTWLEVRDAFSVFDGIWPGSGTLRSRDPRAQIIVERFAAGHTLEQLAEAARGAKLSEHIASNPDFQTVQTIWRDAGQVDKFRRLLTTPPSGVRARNAPLQNSPGYASAQDAKEIR